MRSRHGTSEREHRRPGRAMAVTEWRKRRWTDAPPLPHVANPRPVGLWSRLAGRARGTSSSPGREQPIASQRVLAEQHVWERTAERTCRGFDAWVARGVRGAWHA